MWTKISAQGKGKAGKGTQGFWSSEAETDCTGPQLAGHGPCPVVAKQPTSQHTGSSPGLRHCPVGLTQDPEMACLHREGGHYPRLIRGQRRGSDSSHSDEMTKKHLRSVAECLWAQSAQKEPREASLLDVCGLKRGQRRHQRMAVPSPGPNSPGLLFSLPSLQAISPALEATLQSGKPYSGCYEGPGSDLRDSEAIWMLSTLPPRTRVMGLSGISQGRAGLHRLCPWQSRLKACPLLETPGLSRAASMLPARVLFSSLSSHLPGETLQTHSWALVPCGHQAMAGSALSVPHQLMTGLPQPLATTTAA